MAVSREIDETTVLKEMGENDGAQDGLTEANVNHLTCYKKNEQMICGWTWEVLVRLVLAIVFGLSALLIDPFLRWVEVRDWPNYNYPHAEPETIHPMVVFGLIVLLPLILLICVTLFARPYAWGTKFSTPGMMKKRIGAEWMLVILAASMAYLVNGVITDVAKNLYGRPRPDFLSRCFTPNEPKFRQNGPKGNEWITLPSRIYEFSNTDLQKEAIRRFGEQGTEKGSVAFPYIEDVGNFIDYQNCINSDDHFLRRGGRRSFPSGHTSFAFAGSTFCALYSFYWLGKIRSNTIQFMKLPGYSLRISAFFLWLVPAIYVGISRTQDYRHFPTDVIGGALIGIITTTLCFVQYFRLDFLYRPDPRADQGAWPQPGQELPQNGTNSTRDIPSDQTVAASL